MRLKIIQQLVNVNIIYASQPAQIAKLRAKQAKKPDVKLNVARKSVLNYLFLGLVYFVIFGLLFSIYDFVNQPAFFVNMVALFSLMTISQGFMSFYNVFYESKDLQFYRPYAFSDAEVIAGKSLSVILTLLMAILPLISYFLILPVQAGGFNPLGILLGLFCAVILLGVLFLATILLAHLITKTLFSKTHDPGLQHHGRNWFSSEPRSLSLSESSPNPSGRGVGWSGYSHSISTFYSLSSVYPPSF